MRHLLFVALALALSAVPAGAGQVPNPIDKSAVGNGLQITGNDLHVTGGIVAAANVTTSTRTIADTECGTWFTNTGIGTSVVYAMPANPAYDCLVVVDLGLKITSFDFNGHPALLDGFGDHDMDYSPPFIPVGSSNPHIALRYDGSRWRTDKSFQRQDIYENMIALDGPRAVHGQVQLSHDAGNSRMQLCGYGGFGGIAIRGQNRRLDDKCIWTPDSANSSSATNYYYVGEDLAAPVSSVANNGGFARITFTSITPPVGARVRLNCHSILGTVEANGKSTGDVSSSNVVDTTIAFVNSFSTSVNARCRVTYVTQATTSPAVSSTYFGVLVETGNDNLTYVGFCVVGGGHVPSSCTSWFNGAQLVNGALKYDGAGNPSQAACADLSNATASCSTDATNANNISSGTLAAARGGAGTINGALKGNGSGVVSQAAAADLSNGTTGSGLVVLKQSASLLTPNVQAGGGLTTATFIPEGVLHSITANVGTGTGTGEQDLDSYSMPANALDAAGRNLRIDACFLHAANTHSVTSRVYFGAAVISDTTAVSGAVACFWMLVLKTGSNTQNVIAGGVRNSTIIANAYTAAAETDSSPITIKTTGQDGTSAANDDTLILFTVKYMN